MLTVASLEPLPYLFPPEAIRSPYTIVPAVDILLAVLTEGVMT